MPFTFSHPAIVLPLACLSNKWFSPTGLVIGSLTPDFEYFLRMRVMSHYSHTIGGVFWFNLPLGLFLAFIFHNIVRNSLFDNVPTFLKSRFCEFRQFDWNTYFKKNRLTVIISILIGASSHIFWDSFTHEQGYIAQTIPALTNTIDFIGKQIHITKILQHTSSIIGIFLIAFVIYKMPTSNRPAGNISIKYWTVLTCLTLMIIATRLFCGLKIKQYGDLIVTGISAILLALILTPLLTTKMNGN